MGATDVTAAGKTNAAAAPPPTQGERNMAQAQKALTAAGPGATLQVSYSNGSSKMLAQPLSANAFEGATGFTVLPAARSDRKQGTSSMPHHETFEAAPKSFAPNKPVYDKLSGLPPSGGGVGTGKTVPQKPPKPNDFDAQARLIFPGAAEPKDRQKLTTQLQKALVQLHYLPNNAKSTDGLAGPTTQHALHDFCERYGLPANTPPNEAAAMVQALAQPAVTTQPGDEIINPMASQRLAAYAPAREQLRQNIHKEFGQSPINGQHLNALLHQLVNLDRAAASVQNGTATEAEIAHLHDWSANPASIPTS